MENKVEKKEDTLPLWYQLVALISTGIALGWTTSALATYGLRAPYAITFVVSIWLISYWANRIYKLKLNEGTEGSEG